MAMIGTLLIDRLELPRKIGAMRALIAAAIKTGFGMVAGLTLANLVVDDQAREAGYRWTHDWIDRFFIRSMTWSGIIVALSFALLLLLHRSLSRRDAQSRD